MEDRRKPYSAGSHRYDHALSEGLYDNPGIFRNQKLPVVCCFRQCAERACDRDGCADDRGILQTESD